MPDAVLLHVLTITLASVLSVRTIYRQGQLAILDDRYPHTKASKECRRQLPGSWLLDEDYNKTELVELMRNHNTNRAWIGATRKKLRDWEWVDNSTYCPIVKNIKDVIKPFRYHTKTSRCAVFDLALDDLKPGSCYNRHETCHICNLTSCNLDQTNYSICVTGGKYILAIGNPQKSWYSARKQCQQHGGDLVKLDTKNKRRRIVERGLRITQKLDMCPDMTFYIGLRLDQWIFTNPSGERPVPDTAWLDGQPSNEECAELVLNEDFTTRLRAKNCHYLNTVICKLRSPEECERSEKGLLTGRREEADALSIIIGSLIGSLIFVIVILIAVIIFKLTQTRNKERKRKTNNIQQPELPTSIELEALQREEQSTEVTAGGNG